MSVLNDFESMRLYRKRAEHFERLANDCLVAEERYRYLRVAHHYTVLTDTVQQTDKARVTQRLESLRTRAKKLVGVDKRCAGKPETSEY
jgi:hypothetical protein